MKNEVTGLYDLSDNTLEVWGEIYPDRDSLPTAQELAEIRAIIKAHYRTTAQALAAHGAAHFDDCGTYVQMESAARLSNEPVKSSAFLAAPAFVRAMRGEEE